MDQVVKKPLKDEGAVAITAPRMMRVQIDIIGDAPLMVAKFSAKARNKIEATQRAGSAAKSKKSREARDFEGDTEAARHIGRSPGSDETWDGVAASAFRNAMIGACRAAGFVMTKAKLAIFCEQDGYDIEDGSPLVRIISENGFEQSIQAVRNASGVMDLRARPMWREWRMSVRFRYDADILTLQDVVNLCMRVGMQVGIGEGRPYGREGTGMGMGLFRLGEITDLGAL